MTRLYNYNKISEDLNLNYKCVAVYKILKKLNIGDGEIYAEIESSLIKKNY